MIVMGLVGDRWFSRRSHLGEVLVVERRKKIARVVRHSETFTRIGRLDKGNIVLKALTTARARRSVNNGRVKLGITRKTVYSIGGGAYVNTCLVSLLHVLYRVHNAIAENARL